jgi:RNA polymerase-binding transcription factor DksA
MRQLILSHLYAHLKAAYDLELPEEAFREDTITDREIDASLAFKSDSKLDELLGALVRLENGTFGNCIGCKEPISQSILDRDPTRRICPKCERAFTHAHHGRDAARLHL